MYLVAYDNHGNEIKRWHNADLAHIEMGGERLPNEIKRAIRQGLIGDAQHGAADSEMVTPSH